MNKLGRLLLIIVSSLALAIDASLIGLGWERVLYCTSWMSKAAAMPATILFLIVIFGFVNARLHSTTKTAGVMTISSVLAVLLLVGVTMYNFANGFAELAPMLELLNMKNEIVEIEMMNNYAISGAFIFPVLWIFSIIPAMSIVRRF